MAWHLYRAKPLNEISWCPDALVYWLIEENASLPSIDMDIIIV